MPSRGPLLPEREVGPFDHSGAELSLVLGEADLLVVDAVQLVRRIVVMPSVGTSPCHGCLSQCH